MRFFTEHSDGSVLFRFGEISKHVQMGKEEIVDDEVELGEDGSDTDHITEISETLLEHSILDAESSDVNNAKVLEMINFKILTRPVNQSELDAVVEVETVGSNINLAASAIDLELDIVSSEEEVSQEKSEREIVSELVESDVEVPRIVALQAETKENVGVQVMHLSSAREEHSMHQHIQVNKVIVDDGVSGNIIEALPISVSLEAKVILDEEPTTEAVEEETAHIIVDEETTHIAVGEELTHKAVDEAPTYIELNEKPTHEAMDEEEPTLNAVDEEPTHIAVDKDPTNEAADEEPTPNTVDDEPMRNAVDEEPTPEADDEEPVRNAADEGLTQIAVGEEPTQIAMDKEQTRKAVDGKPTSNAVDKEPISYRFEEEPTHATVEEESTHIAIDEKPTRNTVDKGPICVASDEVTVNTQAAYSSKMVSSHFLLLLRAKCMPTVNLSAASCLL